VGLVSAGLVTLENFSVALKRYMGLHMFGVNCEEVEEIRPNPVRISNFNPD
jgi:hypothetical protein